jgi:hypothetical protein
VTNHLPGNCHISTEFGSDLQPERSASLSSVTCDPDMNRIFFSLLIGGECCLAVLKSEAAKDRSIVECIQENIKVVDLVY